jgi:hypothetical protein
MTVSGGWTEFSLGAISDPAITTYFCTDLTNNTFGTNGYFHTCKPTNNGTGITGAWFSIPSIDMTTSQRFYYADTNISEAMAALNATDTGMVVLTSGSGANLKAACWNVIGGSGNTYKLYDGACLVNAQKTDTAADIDVGFDATAVTGVGFGYKDTNKYVTMNYAKPGYVEPYVLTGTGIDFSEVVDAEISDGLKAIISPTQNIHACRIGFDVGNGTTATTFTEELKTWEFYGDFDLTKPDLAQSHVNDNDIGFRVNASASDSVTFTFCNWLGETPFFWKSENTATLVEYHFCVVRGAGTTILDDDHEFLSSIFDNCGTVQTTAPTIANSVIKNAVTGISIVDPTDFTNNDLQNNTVGMLFDFDNSDTVTLSGITFTGNTTDVEYTGSGVLTIQPTNGTVVGTTLASGTGSITVAASPVTLKIIIKDPDGNLITDSTVNVLVEADTGGDLSVGTDIIKGFTDANGEVSDTRAYTSNQPIKGWIRRSSTTPFYKQAEVSGTINSAQDLTLVFLLESDE